MDCQDVKPGGPVKFGNPFNISERGLYIKGPLLGEGAFGTVIECNHVISGQPCAIKVSHLSMEIEYGIGAFCRHPHILSPIELWFDGLQFFLVMDLILPASKLDYTKCHSKAKSMFAFQLASAVDHMHIMGFMHCDIGQTNIGFCLSEDGQFKLMLLDFGLAKEIPKDTSHASVSPSGDQIDGTIAYMAPETIRKNCCLHWNDVWALTLVIVEMFCGINVPYMTKNVDDPKGTKNVDDLKGIIVAWKLIELPESPIPASFRADESPFGKILLEILETGLAIEPERRDLKKILRLLEQLIALSAES